jgi:hypothetical protein
MVGMFVSRVAQRRYGAPAGYDSICWHDIATVDRVLSSIADSRIEERDMRAEVERKARRFVTLHWPAILRLAHVLYRRGKLDRWQIQDVLSRAEATITLNKVGAAHAANLVDEGKINFGPFTWDAPEDDEDYHLGTSEDDGPQLHYPFGRDGEVYIEALKAAEKEGGAVGDYATKLLGDIAAQKKQSYQPKRARPIDEGIRWRHDGYLKPFV